MPHLQEIQMINLSPKLIEDTKIRTNKNSIKLREKINEIGGLVGG